MVPDHGRRMAEWLGFHPTRSSYSLGWSKMTMHKWKGINRDSVLGELHEPMIVYHIGGAKDVPVSSRMKPLPQPSRPGCFAVIPPETPTTWRVNGESNSYTLHLNKDCFSGLLDLASDKLMARLHLCCGEREENFTGLIAALARELDSPSEAGPLLADAIADSIVLSLLRRFGCADADAKAYGGLSTRTLKRAIERIDNAVEHGVALQALADEVGLSRAHFSKAFRQSTGLAPHRYLIKRRIETARDRLVESDEPLSEIALSCGFSSQAHFTECFHREVGQTPLRYRQTH